MLEDPKSGAAIMLEVVNFMEATDRDLDAFVDAMVNVMASTFLAEGKKGVEFEGRIATLNFSIKEEIAVLAGIFDSEEDSE